MTSPGNNILNLLLGNFKGKAVRVPGQNSGMGVKTSGFADIFNLLTAGGKSLKGTDGTFTRIYNNREFDLLFDDNIDRAVEEKQISPEKLHTQNILNLINNKNFDLKGAGKSSVKLSNQVAASLSPEQQVKTIIDSPLMTVKGNKFLNDLINNQPVELEPGKYLVLESTVKDGRLNLTIQPADNPARQINVKLPIESMVMEKKPAGRENSISPLINKRVQKRVELKAERSDNKFLKIEELFSKLNLKELEIKNLPAEKVTASKIQKAVELKIVAEQAGQEVVIRNKIQKNSLKANVKNRNDINDAKINSRTVAADKVARPVDEIITATANNKTAREWMLNNQKSIEDLTRFDKPFGAEDNLSYETIREPGSLIGDKTISSERPSGQKVELPQVRFSLPDNIKQTLKPGGRAISIQIEPEQLGPARLHLALRDNSLSARLTVDNPQAKAAVEGSLNQLTEQLARCGIKVDYIQVGVNSGEAQNHNFARRMFWNKTTRLNNFNLEDDLFDDMETSPLTITPQPAHYVGAGGVNLLA